MKIKMLKTACGVHGSFSEGRTYEVSDQLAADFIADKAAVGLEPASATSAAAVDADVVQDEARTLDADAERAVADAAPERTTRKGKPQTADATKVPGAKREKRG